ncbi:MAG: phosphate acyltransferase PlsX [Planctomycetes bacterium]|nr:phosphate acyltransferase PlsX [Planctomycetota bacterium]
MLIGVDAMGGDYAPGEVVGGAVAAKSLLGPDDRIVLAGRVLEIIPHLAGADGWEEYISLADCPDVVGMDEAPVEALRTKPDSSIAHLARMHKEGQVNAFISAGNTGACVAACQMYLRRLERVHRPGISILMPTFHGPVALCDVGANVNCRPQHLLQYAIMATIYAERVTGIKSPRVGLLSIGAEDAKGNDLVKKTRDLFKAHKDLRFVGNVEGRDLFRNICDVVVCEGFVGNVCLKLMEGLTEGLFKGLAMQLASADSNLRMRAEEWFKPIMARYDYHEYGGAPLLGVNGICIICHGSSSARAIYNAIRVAKEFATQGVNELITTQLLRYSGNGE